MALKFSNQLSLDLTPTVTDPVTDPVTAPVTEGKIYTLGYSNTPIEKFIEKAKLHNVTTIVDVRSFPSSKYTPQFNRDALASSLRAAGIEYVYGGTYLGGMNKLSITNQLFIEKMEKVIDLSKDQNVAMCCSEGSPEKCHRAYKLSAWLSAKKQISVTHILPTGKTITHEEFLAKHAKAGWGWHELVPGGTET